VLVSVPICHSYGVDIVCASLISGATMILLQRATPLSLAEGLASRAAVWPTVPFQLEQAVRLDCVSHVPRTVVTAGSWLPEGLWRLARERWGVNVGQLYGATEVGTVSVRLGRSDDGANAISVIGTGVGDASLVVVDRNDPTRICMVDEEGELLVRASSMASGYIDGPLRLSDGYWHSGDVARRRSDGEIEITGRWRLLIDVGGFKVNPIEVERVIASHPGVAACLVVGVRASETVERLRALYVQSDAAPPVAEPALRAFVRERLSAAKVPRSFERVDALPRSATGKIMRAHVP
jgi:long-chain acyl-CoA synthetase